MLLRSARLSPLVSSSRNGSSSFYDAVIVGGGMVGNALACSLGQSAEFSGKRILVLEAGKTHGLPSTAPATYSNRVSAVSPISTELFRDLGIWKRLQDYRMKKVEKLHVLESCSHAEIQFDRPEKNTEVAYIIENNAIVGALFDRITESCGDVVEIRTGAGVKDCILPGSMGDLAKLQLENGDVVETHLVIGADGARSRVRDAMGVDYSAFNYEQSGLVATLEIEASDERNGIAWQRFCRDGPIALLPLSPKVSSLVWTTTTEEAKRLQALPKDAFVDELNSALFTEEAQNSVVNQTLFLMERLNPFTCGTVHNVALPPTVISVHENSRASFPLGFGHSHSYVASRAALVGDAAHRVHPLAGQGVNLGWNDVIQLTRCLRKAISEGADIGSTVYLKDYDSVAQRHNVPVMVCIDWLNRLYRTDSPALVMLRSLGLSAVNGMPLIKMQSVQALAGLCKNSLALPGVE